MQSNTPLSTTENKAKDREFLTLDELAFKINFSRSALEKRATARQVPGQQKFGRVWGFRLTEVERRLQSHPEQFFVEKSKPVVAHFGRLNQATPISFKRKS